MLRSLLITALVCMSACAAADDAPRTISVTGKGSAEVEPDHALIRMSIVSRQPTLAAAQKEAAEVTARVLAMTEKFGVSRERVDTTGSSVSPDYQYDRDSQEQVLRGYIADRQIRVEVRDLEKLGSLVEGAVASGVNQVSAPQLGSSKHRDAYRSALANAAKDARANAEQLAYSLDANLGEVLRIDAGSNNPYSPMPQQREMRAMAAGMNISAPETYNAADLKFEATVSVVFELTR